MIMLMHHEMPPVLMLIPSIQTLEVINTQQIPLPSSTWSNMPGKLFREDSEVVIYLGLAGFDGGQVWG
jgi:hypothetical protein